MRHPITIKKIPSPARMNRLKRKALRAGTHVRLLLDEARDMPPAAPGERRSIYDVRDGRIGLVADQVVLRQRDGTRRVLKNRYPTLPA